MEQRRFGQTDMMVSVLGFGGSEIGGSTASTVDRLLGSALDSGLNVIDTAECYGESEALIGQAVGHRRHDYYLFTKCGHASGLDGPDWDPKTLQDSIDRSLQRLKTDYVDLLQLHSCSEAVLRQGDVIDVLERARDAGKTRYIGYSGDRNDALYAVQSGVFDTLQTSVNVADQQAIDLTISEAQKRNIGVIAKRPIANAAWLNQTPPDENAYARSYWERLQELHYPFQTLPAQASIGMAMRFSLSIPGVHTLIVGTNKPDRWQQNAGLIAEGNLAESDYAAIRQRWAERATPDWVGKT